LLIYWQRPARYYCHRARFQEQFGPKEREFAQIVHLEKWDNSGRDDGSFFRKLGKIGRLRFKNRLSIHKHFIVPDATLCGYVFVFLHQFIFSKMTAVLQPPNPDAVLRIVSGLVPVFGNDVDGLDSRPTRRNPARQTIVSEYRFDSDYRFEQARCAQSSP
jgi:hypothetical protein